MKRKLVCKKCGHNTYVVGTDVPMILQSRASICWDCDPKTEKNDLVEALSTVKVDGRYPTSSSDHSPRRKRK
jgi:hypothetical protein